MVTVDHIAIVAYADRYEEFQRVTCPGFSEHIGAMHSHLNQTATDKACISGLEHDPFALPGIGSWACDLRTERLSWNPIVFDIFGLPKDAAVERRDTVNMYVEPFRLELERLRSAAIASHGMFSLEAAIRRPDGEERWIRLKAATRVRNGRPTRLYGLKEDITEERQRWEQLRRSARYDALTGLANRAQFHENFFDLAPGCNALAELNGLALFTLANLAQINRRWGIAAGDACLAAFARRLAAAYPSGAFAARLFGSEFAVLVKGCRPGGLRGIHDPFAGLTDPVPWQGAIIAIQACASLVSVMKGQFFEAEALYAKAALGLETAKRQGEGPLRVVTAAFAQRDLTSCSRALSADQFRLSPREMEALRFIGQGYTTDQVAQEMGISRHTARNFIRRIYLKMDVNGRVDAVRLAAQHGML